MTDETLALAEAMESVEAYEGQDGFWYAVIRTERGAILIGRYEGEDVAQEMGLTVAMGED